MSNYGQRCYTCGRETLYGRPLAHFDGCIVAGVAPDGGEPCNRHPDAPHGFDRNGSHNAGHYVCDCNGWVAPSIAELVLRDACEADVADPEATNTICINVSTLKAILARHIGAGEAA